MDRNQALWGGTARRFVGMRGGGGCTLSFLSLFFFLEKGRENPPKKQGFFVPTEPLKSLEKKGKTVKKNKEIHAKKRRKKQGIPKKQGKEGQGKGKRKSLIFAGFPMTIAGSSQRPRPRVPAAARFRGCSDHGTSSCGHFRRTGHGMCLVEVSRHHLDDQSPSQSVKGRQMGGFQTGGFPDLDSSFLFCPFLSFFVLFVLFCPFRDFPDSLGDGPGIFPIRSFSFSRPCKSTYEEQSRKGPRHNLDLSGKKYWNTRVWNPPGLASLKSAIFLSDCHFSLRA